MHQFLRSLDSLSHFLHLQYEKLQWGDLGGWITGLATMALAGATYWGFKKQADDIDQQRKDLRDQQEQINEQRRLTQRQTEWIEAQLAAHRRAQARQVGASLELAPLALPDRQQREVQYIRVLNKSERPVFAVDCRALDGPHALGVPEYCGHVSRPLSGAQQPSFGVEGKIPFDVLLPDKSIDFIFDRQPTTFAKARFVVRFQDDEGVEWERDIQQRLTEVTEGSAEWSV
ncbi:hypothetical protein [Streptacidiphilus sp. P02-A3a]|uniref:hypothetical protein n=1 Tax=Streptacidiphilus sp. P02-A3a TaxID=2704468 RepID=UPI0015F92DDA|nr:hypothetical protein [Streptacidiphilus sp. P02-A3a]QMU73229.1 hypothetical protein GXP74_38370 [Streptacidiphilus sp. P02-A3a]